MAENLIERRLRWASRPTHFIYLGDVAKAAEWKQFALKKKYQLLDIGNGSPLSHHLEPNGDTKISYRSNGLVDTIIIEVGGGSPHGIAMTPCTSLSPQGFGIPLLGDADTWGSSGVANPNAYVPPITHPFGGKAWQLAFLSHDGKGKKVPEPPKVMHGQPWAKLVGPRKVDGTGHASDLRYGGSQGVAIYIGPEEKPTDTMVFSVKGSQAIWGVQPAPTPSRLYLDGKPFATTRIFLGSSAPVTEAIALGKRDKTLILVCLIYGDVVVFTAVVGKKPRSLTFQAVGSPWEGLRGALFGAPNFHFNKSGTRCSAIIPFTSDGVTDTKIVHVDFSGDFTPTFTVVPASPGVDTNPDQIGSSSSQYERLQEIERPIACHYDNDTFVLCTVHKREYNYKTSSHNESLESIQIYGPYLSSDAFADVGTSTSFSHNESSRTTTYKINGADKAQIAAGSRQIVTTTAIWSAGDVFWWWFFGGVYTRASSPDEIAQMRAAELAQINNRPTRAEVHPFPWPGHYPAPASEYNFYWKIYWTDTNSVAEEQEIEWAREVTFTGSTSADASNFNNPNETIYLFHADMKHQDIYVTRRNVDGMTTALGLYKNNLKIHDIL